MLNSAKISCALVATAETFGFVSSDVREVLTQAAVGIAEDPRNAEESCRYELTREQVRDAVRDVLLEQGKLHSEDDVCELSARIADLLGMDG